MEIECICGEVYKAGLKHGSFFVRDGRATGYMVCPCCAHMHFFCGIDLNELEDDE